MLCANTAEYCEKKFLWTSILNFFWNLIRSFNIFFGLCPKFNTPNPPVKSKIFDLLDNFIVILFADLTRSFPNEKTFKDLDKAGFINLE